MINRTLTPGIFPTARDWLIRLTALVAPGVPTNSWSLAGSQKQTFTDYRHATAANCYWAAQGHVFSVDWPVSSAMRSRHWRLLEAFESRPRVETMEGGLARINPLPGLGYVVDILWKKPGSKKCAILREQFKWIGLTSHVYYVDGLERPAHVRQFFNPWSVAVLKGIRGPQKKGTPKSGWACRLLPRRLLFPDSTGTLDLLGTLHLTPFRKSAKNRVFIAKDNSCLVFDGGDILGGVLDAFARDWYDDTVSTAAAWQELSLQALNGSEVPAACLPDGDESQAGDVATSQWLSNLSNLDADARKLIPARPEHAAEYALSVSLAQLAPFREEFRCNVDLTPPDWDAIWTSDFRNLFYELDADFLVAGFCGESLRLATTLTNQWIQAVRGVLGHIARQQDGEYVDPDILAFIKTLRSKNQKDLLIEDCLTRATDRLLAYESKIVRMTLEGIARQVLAGVACPEPYIVLPIDKLRVRLVKIAKRIAPELMAASVSQGDTTPLEDDTAADGGPDESDEPDFFSDD